MNLAARIATDIGFVAIRETEAAVRRRGPAFALRLGRVLGGAFWTGAAPLIRGRRHLAFRNAAVVLPDAPDRERRRIVRRAMLESGAVWPELACHLHDRRGSLRQLVTVTGLEHLDRALARGRGAIAPSVHLGNFGLIAVWMNRAGHDFRFISRPPHDRRFKRRIHFLSRMSGIPLIPDKPPRICASQCLRTLRGGGIICSQLDQRAGRSNIAQTVDFFGRPFRAFSGTVSLALRTGAPLVPLFIVREDGPRHRLVVEPELELVRTGDRPADVRAGLQRLMRLFEGRIRAHPDQWWWPNRRWERP